MSQDNELSLYSEIALLDEKGTVRLVQHRYSRKLFVKKVLSVYNLSVYRHLQAHPVEGTPHIEFLLEEDGLLTVIEEYLAGDTIREVLNTIGRMGEKEAVSLILQLCSIVQSLHGQTPPIIHRDIKPENVILTSDGILKLLDFNAAKWYDENESKDTKLIGTVGYAAPEQYGFTKSSVQTDIYGIGVLLNTLLTGFLPSEELFQGKTQTVIKKCIELSPKDRYVSVRDLKTELQRLYGMENESKKSWRCFLPPGFRSGNASFIVQALIGYVLLFAITTSMTVKNASLTILRLNRIGLTAVGVILVLLNNNYLDIQKKLPLVKSDKVWIKVCGLLLYNAIAVFSLLFLLVIAEN